jgi:hypothetical protein
MSNRALSVPGIVVNDVPIGIVPNSYTSVRGKGEINVRAESTGGGSSRTVHTEDAETKVGKMKFDMYNTDENKAFFTQWKARIGANAIEASQPGMKPEVGQHMSLKNDPDWEGSADGVVPFEFEGDPLSDA